MIKTVIGTAYGSVYIFVPYCPTTYDSGHVYISNSLGHAEDNMVTKCGLTETEFYLTSSPCPDCAMMLKQAFGAQLVKPTIYIARPYQGKGKCGNGNKKVNTACLAMLAKAGFTLRPWDWPRFSEYLNVADCKNTITVNKEALEARDALVVKYLNDVNNMLNDETQDFENVCRSAVGPGC